LDVRQLKETTNWARRSVLMGFGLGCAFTSLAFMVAQPLELPARQFSATTMTFFASSAILAGVFWRRSLQAKEKAGFAAFRAATSQAPLLRESSSRAKVATEETFTQTGGYQSPYSNQPIAALHSGAGANSGVARPDTSGSSGKTSFLGSLFGSKPVDEDKKYPEGTIFFETDDDLYPADGKKRRPLAGRR
jgi:hypothetical protein